MENHELSPSDKTCWKCLCLRLIDWCVCLFEVCVCLMHYAFSWKMSPQKYRKGFCSNLFQINIRFEFVSLFIKSTVIACVQTAIGIEFSNQQKKKMQNSKFAFSSGGHRNFNHMPSILTYIFLMSEIDYFSKFRFNKMNVPPNERGNTHFDITIVTTSDWTLFLIHWNIRKQKVGYSGWPSWVSQLRCTKKLRESSGTTVILFLITW